MRAQVESLIRAEGNWKKKSGEKSILTVMPLWFCCKWTFWTFSWCQKKGCNLVLFTFQLYLLTLLFQCFHSKESPNCFQLFYSFLKSHHSVPSSQKSCEILLWHKSLFLSKLSNRILTPLCSWQKHWTSKLKTHSGLYAWVLMKFPMCAIQSASYILRKGTEELRTQASAWRWELV